MYGAILALVDILLTPREPRIPWGQGQALDFEDQVRGMISRRYDATWSKPRGLEMSDQGNLANSTARMSRSELGYIVEIGRVEV